MRSRVRLTDSMVGLIISAVLVGIAVWVLHVCDVHAKQHGHHGAAPLFDVEGVQRPEDRAGREVQQGGGGHVFFIAQSSLSTPLNKVEQR